MAHGENVEPVPLVLGAPPVFRLTLACDDTPRPWSSRNGVRCRRSRLWSSCEVDLDDGRLKSLQTAKMLGDLRFGLFACSLVRTPALATPDTCRGRWSRWGRVPGIEGRTLSKAGGGMNGDPTSMPKLRHRSSSGKLPRFEDTQPVRPDVVQLPNFDRESVP
jgi:hypothetical protein